jgi:DNA-binding MarR family transcriptional regulator
MTDFRQALNKDEKQKIEMVLATLDPFHELRGTMPLQYVRAFLLVAREEGLGVGEYAVRAGVSQSVMTRHLSDLGDSNRYHKPGFGLVATRPDPLNRRKHQAMLTGRGKALAHRLIRALSR